MRLEISDLSVSYGKKAVLNGVKLRAEAGSVTVIVGPNGSGKTTLLKAATGEIASTGNIAINGRRMGDLQPWQAAGMRAVLPQAMPLSFPFTVREVVSLGVTAGDCGVDPVAAKDLPEKALARVDLAGFAGRSYQELSGGEQQRVQLARVLCQVWRPVVDGIPRWLFLDEPISSLDIRHQLSIMAIARDFAAAGGGVVAILHDLNLTGMFADHVVVMRGGAIIADGPPCAVLTDTVLSQAYDCAIRVGVSPDIANTPFVLPHVIAVTDEAPVSSLT